MSAVSLKRSFNEDPLAPLKKEKEDHASKMEIYLERRKFHGAIVEVAKRLNYGDFSRGLCCGITTMGNICYLSSCSSFFCEMLDTIMSIFQKIHVDLPASQDELKFDRALYPFFDGMIYSFKALNGQCFPLQGSNEVFFDSAVYSLLAPVTQKKKIEQLASVAGFFNLNTLTRYMIRVNHLLERTSLPLCISFSAASHLFSLFYDPANKRYTLIDPNRLPPKEILRLKEVVELVYRIATKQTKKNEKGQLQDLTSQHTSFGISFIGFQGSIDPEQLPSLQQVLTKKEFLEVSKMKINGEFLLFYAARYRDKKTAQALMSDVDSFSVNLFAAIGGKGRLDIVKLLMFHSKPSLRNPYDGLELTLCLAARNGHLPLVEFLIQLQVSTKGKYKGLSALQHSAKEGHLETLQIILSHQIKREEILSCLELAIDHGHHHVARYLKSIEIEKK